MLAPHSGCDPPPPHASPWPGGSHQLPLPPAPPSRPGAWRSLAAAGGPGPSPVLSAAVQSVTPARGRGIFAEECAAPWILPAGQGCVTHHAINSSPPPPGLWWGRCVSCSPPPSILVSPIQHACTLQCQWHVYLVHGCSGPSLGMHISLLPGSTCGPGSRRSGAALQELGRDRIARVTQQPCAAPPALLARKNSSTNSRPTRLPAHRTQPWLWQDVLPMPEPELGSPPTPLGAASVPAGATLQAPGTGLGTACLAQVSLACSSSDQCWGMGKGWRWLGALPCHCTHPHGATGTAGSGGQAGPGLAVPRQSLRSPALGRMAAQTPASSLTLQAGSLWRVAGTCPLCCCCRTSLGGSPEPWSMSNWSSGWPEWLDAPPPRCPVACLWALRPGTRRTVAGFPVDGAKRRGPSPAPVLPCARVPTARLSARTCCAGPAGS